MAAHYVNPNLATRKKTVKLLPRRCRTICVKVVHGRLISHLQMWPDHSGHQHVRKMIRSHMCQSLPLICKLHAQDK